MSNRIWCAICKTRGMAHGHGPVPTTPPPPVSIVLGKTALMRELEQATAAVQRVRKCHGVTDSPHPMTHPDGFKTFDYCTGCGRPAPCPTLRALDGEVTP